MIRRLNFTGRKRIARRDVTVRLEPAGGETLVRVQLDLARYGLAAASHVFLEAYRQTSWQRFELGTVGTGGAAGTAVAVEAGKLKGFGTTQGVRFRVRVVEETAGDERSAKAPRILALADDVRPVAAPAKGSGVSLLPVDWGDLESHAWKLEIDPETGPLLRVSRRLVSDREAFVASREFGSLVLPAVLRAVLERALTGAGGGGDESGRDGGDEAGWEEDWIRLARSHPGVSAPPGRAGGEELSDEEEDWIDDVVEAFSRRNGVPERFAAWWSAS